MVVSVVMGFELVVSTGVTGCVLTVSVVEGVVEVDESLLLIVGGAAVSEPVDFSGEWQLAAAKAKNAIKTILFM